MKCQFCDRPPTHACLMCGTFYCDDHGQHVQPYSIGQAPIYNSICQDCKATKSVKQKTFPKVFGGMGTILLLLGISINIGQKTLLGGIFVFQGGLFMIIAFYVYMRTLKTADPSDQR